MTACLFGLETEYAIGWSLAAETRVPPAEVLQWLMAEAHESLAHLTDPNGGLFLGNGSRLYTDCGWHPEFCTPECTDPWDAVRYVRAGEQILLSLLGRVRAKHAELADAWLLRCNVDYGGGSTWGCHESYLCRMRRPELPRNLIPHLVSRIVFTGAGGFGPESAGLDFTISPRATYFERPVSCESTSQRGIFHTRDQSLAGPGYHRVHVICGESLCSDIATWLKVGTTALVVAMIDAGVRPGERVELRHPVEAFHAFAADPSCTNGAELVRGGTATAIAVQRQFLAKARESIGEAFMPPWAARVCGAWGEMLDRLERQDPTLHTVLDWSIKRALYTRHTERRQIAWSSLPDWSTAMKRLREASGWNDPVLSPATLRSADPAVREVVASLKRKGLDPWRLGEVRRLRQELFEIDTKFGRLGDGGIFAALDGQPGLLAHRVEGERSVRAGVDQPPASGRARVRGDFIRRCSGSHDYRVSWEDIYDSSWRRLDLSDPFVNTERWLPSPRQPGDPTAAV